jgi:metal-responsive CopG/Arc/MetJ family transcriptional regulator
MSRRRSANPTKAISVTIPQVLLDKLDDKLGYTQSRSAYIAGALRMRLEDTTEVSELSVERLIFIIHSKRCGCHEVITCPVFNALAKITSS